MVVGRPREFDMDEALDAAMRAFWDKGYEATSMADLMDATGLQKGSLYKAFRDKHDLFMQCLKRYLEAGNAKLVELLQHAKSPKRGLRKWVQEMICRRGCEEELRRGCMAVNAIVELGPHDPAVADLLACHSSRTEKLLSETIARGQELGEFRTDKTATELAESFYVFVMGITATCKGCQQKTRMKRLADFAIDLLG